MYNEKAQQLLRMFGRRVSRPKFDDKIGIIYNVDPHHLSSCIRWEETVADTSNQGRGAHASVTYKEETRTDLLSDFKNDKLKLIDPYHDPDPEFQQDLNFVAPTCGLYCAVCDIQVGVGPSAWTRCWQCGNPEPGTGQSAPRMSKNKHGGAWQPSTLSTHASTSHEF